MSHYRNYKKNSSRSTKSKECKVVSIGCGGTSQQKRAFSLTIEETESGLTHRFDFSADESVRLIKTLMEYNEEYKVSIQ